MDDEVYQEYSDGYIVRKMRPSEADIVYGFWLEHGFPPRDDLRIAMDIFENDGTFFVGEFDGKPVVTWIQLPWGNNVFYGTMYYCDPQYRRRHFGSRLKDEVAARFLKNSVLVVDAVNGFVAESNVSKLGYVDMFASACYMGKAKVLKSEYSGQITEVANHNFSKIIEYDNKHFVSRDNPARRQYLERLFSVPSGRTLVSTDSSGEITGLACRRPGIKEGHHVIGPIYASNKDIATSLLSSLCSDITGDVISLDIWKINEEAVEMVKRFELEQTYDLTNQCFNGKMHVYKSTVFAFSTVYLCGF